METKELIQALRADAEWAHANEWETPITLGDHLDAAADALEALLSVTAERDAMKERTRWVPVSERLPEYDPSKGANAYWVAKKTRNGEWQIKLALYSDYRYAASVDIPENVTWRDYDFCQVTNVAYWMPLPEAPKEAQS
jgi:hypothetical protein